MMHGKDMVNDFLRLRYQCSEIHLLCGNWSGRGVSDDMCFVVGSRLSWSLGRALTGWLRAQPDWRIHPRAPLARNLGIRLKVFAISWPYWSIAARRAYLSTQLRQLGRNLRSVRAICASPEMSAMLGRYDRLLSAVLDQERVSAARSIESAKGNALAALMGARSSHEFTGFSPVRPDWPYLSV